MTVFRLLDAALRALIGACILGIMLAVGLQVVARATVGAFSWPEELSVILMIWSLMLAAAYVLNARGHVGISFLVDRIGARPGAAISAAMHALIVVFSLAVIWGSIGKVGSMWSLRTGALGISRAVPNLAIPVSCGLYALVSLRLIAEDVATFRRAR